MSARLLTVQETADYFRMSVSWVYHHSAELGAIKCNRDLRFSSEGFERYARTHQVKRAEVENVDARALLERAARETK